MLVLVALLAILGLVLTGCAGSPSGSDDVSGEASSSATSSPALSPSSSSGDTSSPSPSAASDADCPELVFSDPEFAFELRRTMSAIYAGEADLGECLATAGRITDGDFESWYREWSATAAHFREVGDKALAARHRVTARQAFYRAATYFRTAEFFLHGDPDDPRIVQTWKKSRDAFVAACKLDVVPFEQVRIPYDDTTLPGYFYATTDALCGLGQASSTGMSDDKNGSPPGADNGAPSDEPSISAEARGDLDELAALERARPLLIIQTGFDGCQEELHPYAVAAVERGYNVLTFEGPGQGGVIRIQGIPFRADWEHVVRQVIDYAEGRPDVDPDRIALWGISLGGYMAPRAAAHDHRLAACISDGAVFDVGESLLAGLKSSKLVPVSMTQDELHDYLSGDPKEFNDGIRQAMAHDTTTRWQNEHGMYVFGVDSPALFWAAYMGFSLDGIAEDIRCPTLVCWGHADSFDPKGRQAKQLYRTLACPKTIMEFSQQYEAGYHCQLGAFALSWGRKFDWLDGVMRPCR